MMLQAKRFIKKVIKVCSLQKVFSASLISLSFVKKSLLKLIFHKSFQIFDMRILVMFLQYRLAVTWTLEYFTNFLPYNIMIKVLKKD